VQKNENHKYKVGTMSTSNLTMVKTEVKWTSQSWQLKHTYSW
jgi:hypothetical protein